MPKHDSEISKTDPAEIEQLIDRLKQSNLAPRDMDLVERLLRMVLSLSRLLQQKNTSLKRLKRMIFGPGSDNRSGSRAKSGNQPDPTFDSSALPNQSSDGDKGSDSPQSSSSSPSLQRPGHGRMASSAYSGAKVVFCRHPNLKPNDHCPDPYCRGHLYDTREPAIFIQLKGQPLVGATKYQQEVLRCSACQDRFTASLPTDVEPKKYDESCDVSLVIAKYGAGLPWNRLAQMQETFGVPLPASIQFERCEGVANAVLPIFLHLQKLAANGEVVYSDDTGVKILSCLKENEDRGENERRGTHTTGIVVEVAGHKIVLFANGRRHAGENLEQLLKKRDAGLEKPIQMSDALAANWSGEKETIGAKCLAHARRKFIEIETSFPRECATVLNAISKVYGVEAETSGMSARERLLRHQAESGPMMRELREWMERQFADRSVEPNSALGQAFRYTLRHWDGLTRFLSVERAPLDNNVSERALKRAVLLRKNALFYKNEHGAMIGAILLSLIETSRLNSVSAWNYLLALIRNEAAARENPAAWLPWSYEQGELKNKSETKAA